MRELEKRKKLLEDINTELFLLKKSPLYKYRKDNNYLPVVGEGSLNASIMFVGEAPGRKEAETGRPFCGASGKLLDELLKTIKLSRESVYITNIVKDRPPENRDPTPEEKDLYAPYLDRQISIIKPTLVAALGRHSMEYVMRRFGLESKILPISQAHGKSFEVSAEHGKIIIVALYHPAVAIYNRKQKDTLIKDFKIIRKIIKK